MHLENKILSLKLDLYVFSEELIIFKFYAFTITKRHYRHNMATRANNY